MRSYNPECPLCRKSFDPQLKLSCNHELRDLIALKKRNVMDDEVRRGACGHRHVAAEGYGMTARVQDHIALLLLQTYCQHVCS